MKILEWSKSELDYGRKLMDSAVEGARRGEEKFLHDESLSGHLEHSALPSVGATIFGAGLGWLGGYLDNRRSRRRAFLGALLGGAIGFSAGLIWQNRRLTVSVASGAWKSVSKTRDAHWFEKNPIDYA